MKIFKITILSFFVLFLVSFLLQNKWIYQNGYNFTYFGLESIRIPLAVIFIILFFLGLFLTAISYFLKIRKLKTQLKEKQKNITQMAAELKSLRNLPITETKSN